MIARPSHLPKMSRATIHQSRKPPIGGYLLQLVRTGQFATLCRDAQIRYIVVSTEDKFTTHAPRIVYQDAVTRIYDLQATGACDSLARQE